MAGAGPAEQVNYATSALTLLILTTRIALWIWRRERADASLLLVAASVLVVAARIVANSYYLAYGNAADANAHADSYFDPSNAQAVMTGSVLVLVARVLVTTILWLQVCILLLFYARITYGINWVARVVKITWVAVAATYVAVTLVTLLECRPLKLYWQVTPDPGRCARAYAQLLTQTLSNIALDVLLIVIAWPIAGLRKRTFAEHVTLYTLFALGTFCIVVSVIRIVSVRDSGSSQVVRSLWASVQMLVSTFVANAPSIYGSVRALRLKRPVAGGGGASGGMGAQHYPGGSHHEPGTAARRAGQDSWLKMDDHHDEGDSIALTARATQRQSYIRPLPPATTFYDDDTAPEPYSHHRQHHHHRSLEDGCENTRGDLVRSNSEIRSSKKMWPLRT